MFIYQRVTLDKPMEKSHSGVISWKIVAEWPPAITGRL
jgi:hypothetical protein